MIWVSRKRGYSDETIIATAVVRTNSRISTTGSRTHVQTGVTPHAITKMNTTTRLGPRLNTLVSTTDRGITRRGNWVLRMTPSYRAIEPTADVVASWKNPNSTRLKSRRTG